MKNGILGCAILVASTFGCASAFAADVVQPIQQSIGWSGFYAGVNLGYGWGSTNWSDIIVPSDSGQDLSGTFSSTKPSGIVGGIQAGYNFEFAPKIVWGFEGGLSGAGLSDSKVCFGNYGDYQADCHTKVDWMADLAVRLGFTPMDRLLIYGKAGGAYAHVEFQPQNGPDAGGYASTSDDRFGYLVGVGAEYAFNNRWTFGLEYDYRNFGKNRVDFTPNPPLGEVNVPFSANTSLNVNTLVARINYRF